MSTEHTYVLARVGRAGLGNELFPFLRAHEYAQRNGAVLLPSTWWKLRIGPYVRREADKREYWRLFHSPSFRDRAHLLFVRLLRRRRLVTMEGMADKFSDLGCPGPWYRGVLEQAARTGVISPPESRPGRYIAFHVRLGDFAPPSADHTVHDRNNVSTPMGWYESVLLEIRKRDAEIPVLVSSDGGDHELNSLLAVAGVRRSQGANALDDMMVLADAAGIVGSRSTFSAWGAFLGATPLLVALGGNAYTPHNDVFEGEDRLSEWWDTVSRHRSASSGTGSEAEV